MNVEFVAWVPEDDAEHDFSHASRLAICWIENEWQRRRCARPILATNPGQWPPPPEIEEFERRYGESVTRRSPARLATIDPTRQSVGPVLSYVPFFEDLEFAARLARGSSLAVVESIRTRLHGWAAWLGAINLVTGERTPGLPETTRDAVDRLKFYSNNAFADDYGKRDAARIVRQLRSGGVFDRDLLLGAVFAAGVDALAVKNLAKLIDKPARRPSVAP